MARLFNGTSDVATSASAIPMSGMTKWAFSGWLWWDAFSDDNHYAFEIWTGAAWTFGIVPNSSSTSKWHAFLQGNVGSASGEFTRPSAAAWHQYVVNVDLTKASAEVDSIYMDGNLQTITNAFDNNNASVADGTLRLMNAVNNGTFSPGRWAEVAIYSGVSLTQGQVTSLQTQTPDLVGSATYGWHLLGAASPEPAFVGGIDLNLTGTTQTDHPPALTTVENTNITPHRA
jgi:hypothetical protein